MGNKMILAINPRLTSTKIAVYEGKKLIFQKRITHSDEELAPFSGVNDQYEFRKSVVLKTLTDAHIDIKELDAVVGRGGLLKPLESGVYRINDKMMRDFEKPMGEHISNLGAKLAKEIASDAGKNTAAFTTDPECVDEFDEVARISGVPELPRMSLVHALNQKAVARRFAHEHGTAYEEVNIIVAHMGRGITVGAHRKGRIVDTNNGLNGDGPITPVRSGAVPGGQLVELCFSGEFTKEEVLKKLNGNGGLMAYLGTADVSEVVSKSKNGDEKARLMLEAMVYQIAKEIGAMGTVLKGEVDGILLTGGIAYNQEVNNMIIERVQHIAPVFIFAGEDEMHTLAMNGLMVLEGEMEEKVYS